MTNDRLFVTRLEALISKAEALLAGAHGSEYSYEDFVDSASHSGWRAQATSALVELLGESHPYTKAFEDAARDTSVTYVKSAKQVLESLLEDLKNGYLKSLSTLISAEVFSDFLEMGRHLLDNGYKDPAAMLVGAVLEDGLKRIAAIHQTGLGGREGMMDVNTLLSKANVYTSLKRDQVSIWIRIRNSADHAQFDQYTTVDVEAMHSGVVQFLADYLS